MKYIFLTVFFIVTLFQFKGQQNDSRSTYVKIQRLLFLIEQMYVEEVDEEKVKEIIGTDLRPTSMLCIGYPIKKRPAKQRRQLKELIHVVTKKD